MAFEVTPLITRRFRCLFSCGALAVESTWRFGKSIEVTPAGRQHTSGAQPATLFDGKSVQPGDQSRVRNFWRVFIGPVAC